MYVILKWTWRCGLGIAWIQTVHSIQQIYSVETIKYQFSFVCVGDFLTNCSLIVD